MKIFISWSGELSRRVAELLKDWIPHVIQSAEPWISTKDIGKGEVWFPTISDRLAASTIGIICLTKENLNAPWILFEAGALFKGLSVGRVCPLLIDLETKDVNPPLSQFNLIRKAEKEEILSLMHTVNSAGDKPLSKDIIDASVSKWWPDLEQGISQAVKNTATAILQPRSTEEMIVEILTISRTVQFYLRNSAVESLLKLQEVTMCDASGTQKTLAVRALNPDELEFYNQLAKLNPAPRKYSFLDGLMNPRDEGKGQSG